MNCKRKVDVAVMGGGPAGVAAACAAGRAGASVLLLEGSGRLGGSVTAAMHRSICGLYAGVPADAADTLNGGGQREVVIRMQKKAPGGVMPRQVGKVWVLEFPMPAWESALAEMCAEAGVQVRMHAGVAGVRREAGRIAALQVEGSDWVETGAVIDCAGGRLLQLIGEDAALPAEAAAERMLGGFSVRLGGLVGDLEMLRLQVPYTLRGGVESGELPAAARLVVFYPGAAAGEGICKLAVEPRDFGTLRAAEAAREVVAFLQREMPAFTGAVVLEESPRALARDGRRLRGRTMVKEDDILGARKQASSAARAWWPMEWWDMINGPTYVYPPVGDYYDIPEGALVSAGIENLFAGGGCVCATARAAASLRASGICLATGDVAGRLAALHVGAAFRGLDAGNPERNQEN